MASSNVKFLWDKKNKDNTSNFFSFDAKIEKSVSDDYGYEANKICTTCNGKVETANVCTICGTVHISDSKDAQLKKKPELFNGLKLYIGKITKRKDKKTNLIFDEEQRKQYVERETDKTLRVLEEIDAGGLLPLSERFEKPYELYSNEPHEIPVMTKIHGYLAKYNKALVCTFGLNSGKSNKIGGILIAGKDKLILMQLLDYRLIRPTKQEGMYATSIATQYAILDEVSENRYPEMIQQFLELVASGKQIEVAPRPIEKKEEIIPMLECLD
jgi:hypothetical protein